MAAPYFFSNVNVSIESALGTAKTITDIANEANATVTSTAHGISDGSIVLLEVEGMPQLDDRLARTDSAITDAFDLEGITTTNMGDFVSGTAKVVTFGTTLPAATGITISGGDAQYEEWTLIQDTARRRVPVGYAPWSLQFECLWDPTSAVLQGLQADADNFTQRCVQVAMSGGYPILLFRGYVSCTMLPEGQAQGLVRTRIGFDASGRLTTYGAAQA